MGRSDEEGAREPDLLISGVQAAAVSAAGNALVVPGAIDGHV
jgi:hypothetical protein